MLSPFHPMQLALGFIIWSVYFVAIYAGLSIGCAFDPPPSSQGVINWLNGSLLILTLVVGCGLLWQARRCWRARDDHPQPPREQEVHAPENSARLGPRLGQSRSLIVHVALGVNLIGGLATLAIGAPLLVLMPCL